MDTNWRIRSKIFYGFAIRYFIGENIILVIIRPKWAQSIFN